MTSANFKPGLKLVLAHEGGFSDHPKDPGGATMKGVIQSVYDAYRTRKGLPLRSVRLITQAELEDIYGSQYWKTVHADDLPAGLDYAVFDYAVNSGPGRAVKDLQRCLGVKVDGVIGMGTLAAVRGAADLGEEKLIEDYCQRRMKFLRSLKTWGTFGKGWKRRVLGDMDTAEQGDCGVQDFAVMMARNDLAYPIPKAQLPAPIGAKEDEVAGKGEEAQQAQLKTAEGAGLTCAAAGAGGTQVKQLAESVQVHMGMDTILGRLAFVVFALLMLVGGVLIGYSYIGRIREKGGLGGFVGSVFKGAT